MTSAPNERTLLFTSSEKITRESNMNSHDDSNFEYGGDELNYYQSDRLFRPFRNTKRVIGIILAGAFLCLMVAVSNKRQIEASNIYKHARFPEKIVWGSATSSYQIEGAVDEDGRGASIWDTFCEKGSDQNNCNGNNANIACDHYHRFESDVQLMRQLGLKAYRFSISWSRIFPKGTGKAANPAGIAFYNGLIDMLLTNGIEPWVTLYHWDLPQALETRYGGWRSRQIVEDFGNYSRICFAEFGDRVKHWITINDGWTVAIQGYDEGSKAPGRSSHTDTEPYLVAHHLILAHARAVSIYRSEFGPKHQQGNSVSDSSRGSIGIAINGDYRYPLDSISSSDHEAAERAMLWQVAWFADPIWKGHYPETMRDRLGERLPEFTPAERDEVLGSSDFFGLNHYSTQFAHEPLGAEQKSGEYSADMNVAFSSSPAWRENCMGWPIVPGGCRDILKWIDERYYRPIIYMTENGSCEDEPDLESALSDHGRQQYFEGYLRACSEAIQVGVDLRGYFAWSLMDNFEWENGYSNPFGICHVDFKTQERRPKYTAIWYHSTIEANGKNIEY